MDPVGGVVPQTPEPHPRRSAPEWPRSGHWISDLRSRAPRLELRGWDVLQYRNQVTIQASSGGSRAERIRHLLGSRSMPWWAAAFAVLLSAPSLWGGFQLDDHSIPRMFASGAASWDVFNLRCLGSVEQWQEQGFVGWWAAEDMSVRFLRPLSSLTHALDFRLWPGAAWLMHAENVALYGLLVLIAALLFRRLCVKPWAAGLAALLFAANDVHAQSVGWISGRNTLLATLFGLAALLAHDRWRRDHWRAGAVVGPILLLASLLSAEAGLACVAYLLAHALCLDRASWPKRIAALAPCAVVAIGWRVAYVALGYGATGTGLYRDVGADPLAFLISTARNTSLMGFAELTLPVSSPLLIVPGAWIATGLVLAGLAWLLRPLWRRDPVAGFFALGMLAACAPFGATLPADRLLLPAGLGGAGLVAQLWAASADGEIPSTAARWSARSLLVLHGALSPLLFAPSLFLPLLIESPVQALTESIEPAPAVVVVNAPLEIVFLYPQSVRFRGGDHWPDHVYPLFAGTDALQVTRTGPRELELRSVDGWLASPVDRITRSADRPLRAGAQVRLEKMTVEVLDSTDDGRPTRARFRFTEDLDQYGWVAWTERGPQRWSPPPIGQQAALEAALIW